MMDKTHIIGLLEACIELELGVASLYRLFSDLFPEDREFWSQLWLEEKNHAGLLRAALDSYSNRELLPLRIVPPSFDDLIKSNMKLTAILEKCQATPPTRRGAFQIAISLENESGEEHYNQFMGKEPESVIEEVFQQLNRDDKDHETRLRAYHDQLPTEAS